MCVCVCVCVCVCACAGVRVCLSDRRLSERQLFDRLSRAVYIFCGFNT